MHSMGNVQVSWVMPLDRQKDATCDKSSSGATAVWEILRNTISSASILCNLVFATFIRTCMV